MNFFRLPAVPAAITLALAALPMAAQAQTSNLQALHDALHLNAGQEPAWQAFKTASQPNADQAARARAAQAMLPHLTSPQRVDLSIAAMQADLDTLKTRGAALKSFYAMLSPGQQQIFDRQTKPATQP
jgi:hypothetical protein